MEAACGSCHQSKSVGAIHGQFSNSSSLSYSTQIVKLIEWTLHTSPGNSKTNISSHGYSPLFSTLSSFEWQVGPALGNSEKNFVITSTLRRRLIVGTSEMKCKIPQKAVMPSPSTYFASRHLFLWFQLAFSSLLENIWMWILKACRKNESFVTTINSHLLILIRIR